MCSLSSALRFGSLDAGARVFLLFLSSSSLFLILPWCISHSSDISIMWKKLGHSNVKVYRRMKCFLWFADEKVMNTIRWCLCRRGCQSYCGRCEGDSRSWRFLPCWSHCCQRRKRWFFFSFRSSSALPLLEFWGNLFFVNTLQNMIFWVPIWLEFEGFLRIYCFTNAKWLDLAEIRIRPHKEEGSCLSKNISLLKFSSLPFSFSVANRLRVAFRGFSSGFLPLSIPLAPLWNIFLFWIPFYDSNLQSEMWVCIDRTLFFFSCHLSCCIVSQNSQCCINKTSFNNCRWK